MYKSIDLFKLFCSIMVVGIHTQPLGERLWGGYFPTTIFRIAVPFFFVFSSFLYFSREGASVQKYVKRMILLDLAWTIAQSPFILYKFFVVTDDVFPMSLIKFVQSALFGESYMGSWFIHASWLGMMTVCALVRAGKWFPTVVGIICFILALLDTSYNSLIRESILGDYWISLSNVILPSESFIVAVPYMLCGYYMAKNECRFSTRILFYTCVVMMGMLLIEAYCCRFLLCNDNLVSQMNNPRFEQFVCLPFLVVFVIQLLMRKNIDIKDEFSKIIRNLSILIYLSHQVLMLIIYKITGMSEGFVFFIITIVMSAICSLSILKLSTYIKKLKYLY